MRWGLFSFASLLVAPLVVAACDTIERDAPARYYIAPDADDGVDLPLPDGAPGPVVDPDGGVAGETDGPADAPGNGAFNPATLPLTGWWRASYTGSPWLGVASAGTSAGKDCTEAANPPGLGALNGLTPPDLDGVNDKLTIPTTLASYYGATYSGWALVNLDVVSTDSAIVYENDGILSTQPSAYWTLFVRSSGVVGIRHVPAAEAIVTTPFTVAQWQLVQWRFDGTNVSIRVNGGVFSSAATTALGAAPLASSFVLGTNYAGTQFIDGKVAEVGLAAAALTDAQFNDVKAYVNARYNLAL